MPTHAYRGKNQTGVCALRGDHGCGTDRSVQPGINYETFSNIAA